MARTRVFKNPETLNEMLRFRRNGYTYDELALFYKVDRTSIKHWCDIYGLGGSVIELVKQFYKDSGVQIDHEPRVLVIDISQPMWIDDEIEGKVCLGKSYAEYLSDSKKRNPTGNKTYQVIH